MKMKRKRRKRSDRMEAKAFIRAITRLRSDIQYLKGRRRHGINGSKSHLPKKSYSVQSSRDVYGGGELLSCVDLNGAVAKGKEYILLQAMCMCMRCRVEEREHVFFHLPNRTETQIVPGLLGDFKDSEQSEGPEAGEADGALLEDLDEDELEEGAGDDHGVELVEGRLEVDPRREGEHAGQHLDDERRQEGELAVI